MAYIDIMGFKDMVARNTHEDIYEMMKKIDTSRAKAERIDWANTKSKLIKTTTYSDSMMVYSKDDSINSYKSFRAGLGSLVYDLFINGIPHKGAVAFGKMTLDTERSIFFGQPLIDAYLLQDELHFYGIILHGSAENKIGQIPETDWPAIQKGGFFLTDYSCPLKNGKSQHKTICPVYLGNDYYKEKQDNLFQALNNMRHRTSGHLRRYIENTEDYFKHVSEIRKKDKY